MIQRIRTNLIEARKFIIAIYAVGIVGFALPWTEPYFQQITPITLVVSALLLAQYHPDRRRLTGWWAIPVIYLAGMVAEIAGVQTGAVFGSYRYGDGLGFKIMGTPWLIGLNWALLVYASSALFAKTKIHGALKVLAASVVMVVYDVVLEQVAPHLDMWYWQDGKIPMQNYIAWFVLAILFNSLLKVSGMKTENRFAATLLATQFVFFLLLMVLFYFLA
jgi:bisanhydrobacterioruberin hydratase